ncbi:MAG: hypothetical protein Q8P32_04340 [Candidatus Komeilibacteria bacterium]|nr:hypothetical protein [Candidatus Komeilibacteria bacterium]
MSINKQQRSHSSAKPLVWLALAVFILTVGFYQLLPLARGQETSLNLEKYQSALVKAQALITSLPEDIFSHPLLNRLKQPIPMPFEAGAVGNSNPFQLPQPPEILLQQGR